MADDTQALAAKAAEAAHDGLVLAELAVARERREIGDEGGDVVEAVRSLRMTRDLRLLPRRQAPIERLQRLCGARLEAFDLLADRHRIALGAERAQFLDLGLEVGHRLFEVEIAAHRARFAWFRASRAPEPGLSGLCRRFKSSKEGR